MVIKIKNRIQGCISIPEILYQKWLLRNFCDDLPVSKFHGIKDLVFPVGKLHTSNLGQ